MTPHTDHTQADADSEFATPDTTRFASVSVLLARAGLMPPGGVRVRGVVLRLVLALALSAVLWAGVSAQQDPVVVRHYSFVAIGVQAPRGYYQVTAPPPAQIVVQGLASDFPADTPPPRAVVDLTSASSGAATVATVQVRGLREGVELVRVTPSNITLRLEKVEDKPVLVLAVSDAAAAAAPPGFNPPTFSVSRNQVTVKGPHDIVDQIAYARVVVNTSMLTQDETVSRDLAVYDRTAKVINARQVSILPPRVDVAVTVQRQPYPQQLPVQVVLTGKPAPGYVVGAVTVAQPLVSVYSNKALTSNAALTTQPITVSGWTSAHQIVATLVAPAGATLPQRQTVVDIKVVPLMGSGVTTIGILTTGKRPGTTATLLTRSLSVAYQGSLPILRAASAPVAVVDLGGRAPGVYELRPAVTLDAGLTLVSTTPSRVRVRITAPPQSTPAAASTPTAYPTATATSTPTAHRSKPHVVIAPAVAPRTTATATPTALYSRKW